MANQQHVKLLEQGWTRWNPWRSKHPEISPDLNDANLAGADLSGADLSGADLSGADLVKADLSEADLSGANLSGAYLNRTDLSRTDLSRSNLSRADLDFVDLSDADLSDADLSDADLGDADLRKANLRGANLSQASLGGANLSQADLSRANLSGADLRGVSLSGANLSGADLSGADLSRVILVETDLTGAILNGCSIHGISVWNVQLEGAKQNDLLITASGESKITVDDLEVAQFIYLLLNHKKLRNTLNAVTERGVLLLGRFGGGGLEMLQAVAAKLREEKYLPIIFDFERPHDRNYTETVKTLVGLSRFIIADLSGPSVPQELYATVPHFKIPFVPILEAGRKQFAMAVDLLEYPWVVRPPVIFTSTDELVSLVPSRIIAPAEEKHLARQQLFDELFR